ncbi:hypothetical protein J6590_047395 [Homalodisca vitripennis]|nr:hypothetical protein J6590_047395 [Homalodisca vitripennis]
MSGNGPATMLRFNVSNTSVWRTCLAPVCLDDVTSAYSKPENSDHIVSNKTFHFSTLWYIIFQLTFSYGCGRNMQLSPNPANCRKTTLLHLMRLSFADDVTAVYNPSLYVPTATFHISSSITEPNCRKGLGLPFPL